MPVFSNQNTKQIGLKKNFQYGVSSDLSASLDQRNGSSATQKYKEINTLVYNLTLGLDLWRDLFGKITKAKLENADLYYKNAKDKKEIEMNSYLISVRRMYWQLVALNEKLKISKILYQQALEQEKDAKRRLRSNIADKSEVARYESQVATRRGTVLVLQYQREGAIKNLRNLIPALKQEPITMGFYDVEKNINNVLECTAFIGSHHETPYKFTKYDEIAARLKVMELNQVKIDDSGDDIDLKMNTSFFTTGLGSDAISNNRYEGSYDLAREDMSDNDRSGFAAGLSITIPIGVNEKSSAEVATEYNKRHMKAQRENMLVNLDNTHEQISRSVNLLAQVVQSQKDNSDKLGIRLKEMKKKYNQARISVSDLINDQDLKMNSDLSVVDSRLAVVNTILDYFTVFNETPCSFNRK